MIDVDLLRKNLEKYREVLRKRYMDETLLDEFLSLDTLWRSLKEQLDSIKCSQNVLTRYFKSPDKEKILNDLKRCGYMPLIRDLEKQEAIDREKLVYYAKLLKNTVKLLEEELREVERKRREALMKLPNWLAEDVPIGPDDSYNKPLKYWGIAKVLNPEKFKEETQRKVINVEELDAKYIKDNEQLKNVVQMLKGEIEPFYIDLDGALDFELLNRGGLVPYVRIKEAKHHYDLTKELKVADQELGGKIAGSRFYVEYERGLFMELKLIQFVLNLLKERTEGKYNYMIVKVPYMVKRWVEEKAAYYTAFEDTLYKIEGEDLFLNPTAEHPIAAMFKDKLFDDSELPLVVYGFSTAFRKEAGSHGKDTKGIFRVHQFEKVEQYAFTPKERLMELFNFLVSNAEAIVKKLMLPYRIVYNSSGDMDKRVTRQWDLEVYYPAQERYRELHSFGTVEEWHARRLNIKYSKGYVNTIYATALPIQRAMTALLENNLFEFHYNRL